MNNVLKMHPTVCVVGKTYQIKVVTWCDAFVSIRVGDKTYYNHSNGIKIAKAGVQSFTIPSKKLDEAKAYTVIAQPVIDRCPYYPRTGETVETEYNFKPLEKTEDINIYHLADVHGWKEQSVAAAKFFDEETDLLILNGDIVSYSNTINDMLLCYEIASDITEGTIPCIISRGNHDLRGYGAEDLAKYMPGDNGKSYYTFRIGCIWGILVDTGEDKADNSEEYGGSICCHEFRLEQEEMIKEVIENAKNEYEEEDVKYRLVISHVPFTFKRKGKFDIERDIYTNWSKLLKENVKPNFMLCGHTHDFCISENGSEYDDLGQPCTIIVGSDVNSDTSDVTNVVAGAFIKLNLNSADVKFNTQKQIIGEGIVKF